MARHAPAPPVEVVEAEPIHPDDLAPFELGMAVLSETFQREITPILARTYRMALRDLPEEVVPRAVDHLLMTFTKGFPRPAELLAAAEAVMTPDERELYQGIRYMRSCLSRLAAPVTFTPERLVATRRALGLPSPDPRDLERLRAERDHLGLNEHGPTDYLAGPVEAFLLGGGRIVRELTDRGH